MEAAAAAAMGGEDQREAGEADHWAEGAVGASYPSEAASYLQGQKGHQPDPGNYPPTPHPVPQVTSPPHTHLRKTSPFPHLFLGGDRPQSPLAHCPGTDLKGMRDRSLSDNWN